MANLFAALKKCLPIQESCKVVCLERRNRIRSNTAGLLFCAFGKKAKPEYTVYLFFLLCQKFKVGSADKVV